MADIPCDPAESVSEPGQVAQSCVESASEDSIEPAEIPICCPNGHGMLLAARHCFSCGWPDAAAVERWQKRGGKPIARICGQCNAKVLVTAMGKCRVCGLDLITVSEREKIKPRIFAGQQSASVLTSDEALSKVKAAALDSHLAFQARASWLLPLLAWASQILFGTLMRVIQLPWEIGGYLCMAMLLVQAVILVAGIGFGGSVLLQDPALVTPKNRMMALIGLAFSAGTIALIIGLLIINSL